MAVSRTISGVGEVFVSAGILRAHSHYSFHVIYIAQTTNAVPLIQTDLRSMVAQL